jgi:hypothetical protein
MSGTWTDNLGQSGTWTALPTPTLWLGNDMSGDVFATDLSGQPVTDLANLPRTGIAYDGTHLYFGDRGGNIEQRSTDGQQVLKSFNIPVSGCCAEDLAWDTKRQRLWRIDHGNRLHEIDVSSGTEDRSFLLPTTDPAGVLTPLGGLGVAYDTGRDLLYVSFCQQGCVQNGQGIIETIDPSAGTVTGVLFRSAVGLTAGLAYEADNDTLWVGDVGVVHHFSRSGTVLSTFNRPLPGGAVDGLEFVPSVGTGGVERLAVYAHALVGLTGSAVVDDSGLPSGTRSIAQFTEGGSHLASEYTATIDWGDGNTSTGSINRGGSCSYRGINLPFIASCYAVSGSHTYGAQGAYVTTVTVSRTGTTPVTVQGVAQIQNPPAGGVAATKVLSKSIGVLSFLQANGSYFYCTGTALAQLNVIVTAKHCGASQNAVGPIEFAPGHIGDCKDLNLSISQCDSSVTPACASCSNPYGFWTAFSQQAMDSVGFDSAEFIVMRTKGSSGKTLQQAVHGLPVFFQVPRQLTWSAFGYPMNETNNSGTLVSCGPATDFISFGSDMTGLLTMGCEFDHLGGAASGTSGSPWIAGAVISNGLGAVEKGTFQPCPPGSGSSCFQAGLPLDQVCTQSSSDDPHCVNVAVVGDGAYVDAALMSPVGVAAVSVFPNHADYLFQPVGQSTPAFPFDVENDTTTGISIVVTSGFRSDNPEFSVSTCPGPTTIAAHSSGCLTTITFTPQNTGTRVGHISVDYVVAGQPAMREITITVVGVGY